MFYEIFDKVLEIERTRAAVNKSDIIYREARLKRRIFEEHIENHIGVRILLQFNHDTDTLHRGLIVDI